ncbi:hypothetical protein PT931_13495 [Longispora urticae]
MHLLFPDLAVEGLEKPIIANFVDVCARDLAELIAPLPAINTSSASMSSDSAKRFADKRSKIARNYFQHSRLDVQMFMAADQHITYGVGVFIIEPDFKNKLPRITVEDAMGGYAEVDRYNRIISYTRRYFSEADKLAVQFPEYADQIMRVGKSGQFGARGQVELIRYMDADQVSLMMVAGEPVFLTSAENRLKECPVVLARRWGLDNEDYQGQFDSVIYVQQARDILSKLNLEAITKAVQAPIAIPADVQEFAMGPDARIRSNNAKDIHRVDLNIPPSAFQEEQLLLNEMQQGARYPAARQGNLKASIITGKGVEALTGTMDTQVKAAQQCFAEAFERIIAMCFKMDELYWPDTVKNVRGTQNGTPFEIDYSPAKDIKGEYHSSVMYGFAAGLDPNRAAVLLLQLLGAGAISKDFFMRQLPFEMDVTSELNRITLENTREALMQGVYAYVQAIPAMAQSGMDPSEAVMKLAAIIHGLQKGKAIEDVVSSAFAPQVDTSLAPAPPPGGEMGPGGPPGTGPGGDSMGGLAGGLSPSGLMRGVPQGQAGMAPGGRPDLQVMAAGLTGAGKPSMSASVLRRRGTG